MKAIKWLFTSIFGRTVLGITCLVCAVVAEIILPGTFAKVIAPVGVLGSIIAFASVAVSIQEQ